MVAFVNGKNSEGQQLSDKFRTWATTNLQSHGEWRSQAGRATRLSRTSCSPDKRFANPLVQGSLNALGNGMEAADAERNALDSRQIPPPHPGAAAYRYPGLNLTKYRYTSKVKVKDAFDSWLRLGACACRLPRTVYGYD